MNASDRQHRELEADYVRRYETILQRLADNLQRHITDLMGDESRIDRIAARAKSPSSFLQKALMRTERGLKYSEPLQQIQDQLGARIVVFFEHDVRRVAEIVKRYFTAVENRRLIPETESEFGYFGHHLVLVLPTDVIEEEMDDSLVPDFFELQIKTLFQHAWSEADHDLGYKPGSIPLTSEQKRKVAFTAAQAWGADLIFAELFVERKVRDDPVQASARGSGG